MPKVWSITSSKGFASVEVLLAATIFGMLVTALIGALVYGELASANGGEQVRANMLAEEGIEAVRNIRDAAYANLADGTYGLVQSGGSWTLSGTSDTTGIFTRKVTIASVDSVRKNITSTVNWQTPTGTSQIAVTSRLTNWLAALTVSTSWSNASMAANVDLPGNTNGLKVATQGNYAYIIQSGSSNNFAVIDISNPSSPSLLATLTLAGSVSNIAVSGNYAYIAASNNNEELQIVNISNPSSPTIAGFYNAPGTANGLGIFVSGSYAYLVRAANGGNNELVIVNVSNPASPTLVGGYSNNVNMNEVYVYGNYAYITSSSDTQEMLIINTSNKTAPVLAGSVNLPGTNDAISIVGYNGNRILISQANILYAYNTTSPTAPSLLGSITLSAAINDIDVDTADSYAFAGTDNTSAEFQVVTLANLSSMSLAQTVDTPGSNNLNGVSYNSSLNIVAGASTGNTSEGKVFQPN